MQVLCDGRARAWIRARIAPAFSGAIIPARPCEFGDLRLNVRPGVAGLSRAGIKNDRWAAFARAIEVQRSPSNINRLTDAWESLAILPASHFFVNESCDDGKRQRHTNTFQSDSNHTFEFG